MLFGAGQACDGGAQLAPNDVAFSLSSSFVWLRYCEASTRPPKSSATRDRYASQRRVNNNHFEHWLPRRRLYEKSLLGLRVGALT